MKLTNEYLLRKLREGRVRDFFYCLVVAISAGNLRWKKKLSKKGKIFFFAPNFEFVVIDSNTYELHAMSSVDCSMSNVLLPREDLLTLKRVIEDQYETDRFR